MLYNVHAYGIGAVLIHGIYVLYIIIMSYIYYIRESEA